MEQDKKLLIKLAHTKMPFGKYEGRFLIDLPEYYVVWYHNKGFPNGELGQQLALIYELKLNGLEELIRNIKKQYPKPIKIVRKIFGYLIFFNYKFEIHTIL